MSFLTQTTRDELQDFLQFIRAESHILREYPSLLFRRAVNEPDDGRTIVSASHCGSAEKTLKICDAERGTKRRH